MSNFIVKKVAVLGAGVMGAQIAAHCVNAKVQVVLFDLPAKEGPRNGIVLRAIENPKKLSPAPLGDKEHAALNCDIIYAADNATFSIPFTQLGVCPEFSSSILLTQVAGYPGAAEKLLLGKAFSAKEAYDMGLVGKVLPQNELLAFSFAQAAKLAALPVPFLRVTKRLMKAGQAAAIETQMNEEISHFDAMLSAFEAKEAFAAFSEKRKPDFTRRS